ncbi:hypothetical protein LX16_4411 [Stackebrandtia albiflava]|uniref:Uncharacterized protein n=1 Tax=Stackebrandtia albiflava TaxID=406432 RepID=A0A562URE4_9ACTN|nr:hypothetical protein [Stackebrandtia albiflava]TWJ08190.1 hypothetical protein LX16_4411 [Stackebrandtia albiflava]
MTARPPVVTPADVDWIDSYGDAQVCGHRFTRDDILRHEAIWDRRTHDNALTSTARQRIAAALTEELHQRNADALAAHTRQHQPPPETAAPEQQPNPPETVEEPRQPATEALTTWQHDHPTTTVTWRACDS